MLYVLSDEVMMKKLNLCILQLPFTLSSVITFSPHLYMGRSIFRETNNG